jgi:SAM-dependent methyltransferase
MQIEEIVPDAVSRKLEIYKLNMRLRQYGPENINNLLNKLEASSDTGRIERLWTEVKPMFRKEPTSAAKYADRKYWQLLNVQRVLKLNLHKEKPLKILDIGCGPGFFMGVTRAAGHESWGIDAPESFLTKTEARVYAELLESMNIRQYTTPLLIERFKPLPFEGRSFDLITAFWICFNRHREPDTWGVEDWKFFIEDALKYVNPGGRILLELNEDSERFPEMRFYDQATLDYFRSVGSVEKQSVLIKKA